MSTPVNSAAPTPEVANSAAPTSEVANSAATTPATPTPATPTAAGARPQRPVRPQTVLSVIRTQWLAPHLVRVIAGGPGFADFQTNAFTDRYAKMVFANPELGLTPPYDLAALRETLAPDDVPVTRTYTVRSVDEAAGTIAVDFVVHGDEGLAGPWAASAVAGDPLVLAGLGGAYAPDATADWHLFAGDEAALPAIAAALESMEQHARGVAFVEIGTDADRIPVAVPAGIELRWVLRGDRPAGTTSALAEAVASADWLPGRVQVFAHGERESMKALRDIFKQRGVTRDQLSLSGYWAYGRTEDRFQAEKREPVGVIAPV